RSCPVPESGVEVERLGGPDRKLCEIRVKRIDEIVRLRRYDGGRYTEDRGLPGRQPGGPQLLGRDAGGLPPPVARQAIVREGRHGLLAQLEMEGDPTNRAVRALQMHENCQAGQGERRRGVGDAGSLRVPASGAVQTALASERGRCVLTLRDPPRMDHARKPCSIRSSKDSTSR